MRSTASVPHAHRALSWDQAAFFRPRVLRLTVAELDELDELDELRFGIERLLGPLHPADAEDAPAQRDGAGRWPRETQYFGTVPVEVNEGEGWPSRWNTLRALRVVDWYAVGDAGDQRRYGTIHTRFTWRMASHSFERG